ncbi:hypothetical protein JCM11641_006607 [Rhodosporidiobolus odoratus]
MSSVTRDFHSLLDACQSPLLKTRSAAVVQIRDLLSSSRNLTALLSPSSGVNWLETLQTLFQVVILERNAYVAKKTGPNEKRLDEAAGLVKVVAEKVTARLSKKTARALINHLTQLVAVGGELQHFALLYLKALRAVLSYQPHLDHLDERQWTDIVSLCFAGALGDKVKIGREFEEEVAMLDEGDDVSEEEEEEERRRRKGKERRTGKSGKGALRVAEDDDEDEDMYELPDLPSTSANAAAAASSSSARKRTATSSCKSSSTSSKKHKQPPTPARRPATPLTIELLHLLDLVFRSSTSPFLPYATVLFSKFLRFFTTFRYETSAHAPALAALNRALAELDLNDQRSMGNLGGRVWECVKELWATKNAGLKEQVVITLRYLVPFVIPSTLRAGDTMRGGKEEEEALRRAKELYDLVLSEPTIRWREPFELDIDVFSLRLASSDDAVSAFEAPTFRAQEGFEEKHAVAWMTVALGARGLGRVAEVGIEEQDEDGEDGVSEKRRGKRRRVETPLSTLLASLSSPTLPMAQIAYRLQILLFLTTFHWSSLSAEAKPQILSALVPLLSHADTSVARWAFVCTTAIAHAGILSVPSSSDRRPAAASSSSTANPSTPSSVWERIFLLSLRRLTSTSATTSSSSSSAGPSSSSVSRCAAHTLNTILSRSPSLIPHPLLSDSLESFARELDVALSGAAFFPSDAVCEWLEWVLAIAASDARLVRLRIGEKVLRWLVGGVGSGGGGGWKPLDGIHRSHNFGQARPPADPLSGNGILSLVGRLCGLPQVVRAGSGGGGGRGRGGGWFIPDCAAATLEVEMNETRRVREFVEGRVPGYSTPDYGAVKGKGKEKQHERDGLRTPAWYDSSSSSSVAGVGGGEDLEHSVPKRISGWLASVLEGFKAAASDLPAPTTTNGANSGPTGTPNEAAYWSSLPLESARRQLDFSSLALCISALFSSNVLPTLPKTIRLAGEVVTALAPTLALKKWTAAERAFLLGGLGPLWVEWRDEDAGGGEDLYPVLLDPSFSSGIPLERLPPDSEIRTRGARGKIHLESPEMDHLRAIWREESTRRAMEEVLSALRFILGEATEAPLSPSLPTGTASGSSSSGNGSGFAFTQSGLGTATQASQRIKELEESSKEDGFGEIRVGSRAASVLGAAAGGGGGASTGLEAEGGSARAAAATIKVCLKGFISFEMASSGSASRRSVRLQEIVDTVLSSSSGADSIHLSSLLFSAALSGLVSFGLSQAEYLLQYLGGKLLPAYQYARDERFARVALKFLECSMGLWVEPTESAEEFAGDARILISWYTKQLRKKIVQSWRVRLQFTAFLDKYLEMDSMQAHWDIGGNALRAEDNRLITPTAIIPFMLTDRDFRVRFRASTSSAALFNLCSALNLPEQQLFDDIRSNLVYNIAESEQILTQILCNANIMIVAGTRRRAPYHLLVKTAGESPFFTAVTIATLQGVAARLGFDGLQDLYLPYSRYFLHLELRNGPGPPGPDLGQRLSYRACGFSTLRDARKADFNQTASLMLAQPDGLAAFRTMCDVLKRSEVEGRLSCLPETVSLVLARFHAEHQENLNPPYTLLTAELYKLAEGAGAGDAHQQDKLIDSVIDEIFAETLTLTYQYLWPARQEHPALAGDKKAADTLLGLLSLPEDLYVEVEPPPPQYSPDDTLRACIWLDKERKIFSNPAVVFSVVHNLLGKIHRAHFVAEQRRQLLNLAFAISLSHRGVRQHGILATLGDGLISLLPHFDLIALAPPMLRWVIKEWLALDEKQPSKEYRAVLCEQLVRAAHACMALDAPAEENGAQAFVGSLRKTLVDAVRKLRERNEPTTTEASLLWPTRAFGFSSAGAEAIHEALASTFAPIGVGKFTIVSALRDHPDYQALLQREDRGRVLWRLMQAIGPDEVLGKEDCFAFANLLYDVQGEAEAPGVQELSLAYQQASSGSAAEGDSGIKKRISEMVLRHLNDPDRTLASAAFSTAKRVFSVPGTEQLFPQDDPSAPSVFAAYLTTPSLQRPLSLRRRLPRKLDELETGELVQGADDYSVWVKDVAELLADVRGEGDDFYAQLVPLSQISATLAKSIVPYLVHSILLQGFSAGDIKAEQRLSSFFGSVLRSPASSLDAIRLIVDTASHLRQHGRPDLAPASRSRFDSWLALDWVLLAEGAVRTGAYLAALLFLELGHEYNGLFGGASGSQQHTLDERGQALLYDIYAEIDEPDGFYGRESADVRQALLKRYRHEGEWDGAFRTYGARHEAQSRQVGSLDSSATAGVVTSLASFGFNRLAMSVYQPARIDGTLKAQDVPPELPYELAWRTDVWDLPVERQAAGSSSVSLYSALRASRMSRSVEATRAAVASAMADEVKKLSAVTLDLPRPNREALSTILALREVDSLAQIKETEQLTSEVVARLVSIPERFSFEQAERVLSSRISILRGIRMKECVDQVGDDFAIASSLYKDATSAERACLVELSQAARKHGHLQAAFNAVTLAHTLVEDSAGFDVDEELANVLWAQGEHTTAISLLTSVQEKSMRKHAATYARLGEWTGEARMRNPQQVLEESFEPAIEALDAQASPTEHAHVYYAFATFADAQYEELSKTLAEKRQRTERYAARKYKEFDEIDRQLQSGSLSSHKLEKSKETAQAHMDEDRRQVEEVEQSTKMMLWRAAENYAKALHASDEYDDKIFRLCGLGLAHADNDDLHTALKPLLTQIPSHKFVFLAYQLSARLTKSDRPPPSADNIRRLVQRLCTDHPFHALYPVNALRDVPPQRTSRRSSTTRGETGSKNSRSQAASDVIERVKKYDTLRPRVEAVELVLEAYAEWAEHDIKRNPAYQDSRQKLKNGPHEILRSMRIRTKVKNLAIPVTTFDLPVDPTCQYDEKSFPHIVRYDEKFTTAGGIHLPKICTCWGSDGQPYKQLLKGDDDIRQDAVMEQVFALVNSLLARDEGGRRRRLNIRTYKVVPLQRMNGLLEFARNTQPLGSFLTRLYDQMAPGIARKARELLGEVERKHRNRPETREPEKQQVFKKLMKDFPPLLRYLFWQKHKVPSLWFDMRLNYSRSVATTSIIGNIVGLGDRHVSNILMDEATGELVHIDFGIAFDQGKRLPIPELVPFRLTHNLIDGFGMSGVDGVFRRCSEETLRVLRERSGVLMTVLEVFKYDPLQNWAVSADMAKRIQGSDDREAGELDALPDDADRALSIVRGKLDTRLSVQYTVNQLIQEATDANNLATIFSGWQAYF